MMESHQLFLNFVHLVIKTLLLVPKPQRISRCRRVTHAFITLTHSFGFPNFPALMGQTAFHLMYLALSFGILFVYLTAYVSDLQCLNKRTALCVYVYFNLTKLFTFTLVDVSECVSESMCESICAVFRHPKDVTNIFLSQTL